MNFLSIIKRTLWFAIRQLRGSRYKQLTEEIDRRRPRVILEIGTWNGRTAKKMIEAASRHHPSDKIIYHGFDLFDEMSEQVYEEELSKRPPSMKRVYNSLKSTGAQIHLHKGNTSVTLPNVLPALNTVDFVFIDGGHSIQTISSDWQHILQHMNPDTVVIFDDYWRNRDDAGCKPVVDAIDPEYFRVEIMPITDNYINSDFGRLVINFAKVTLTP